MQSLSCSIRSGDENSVGVLFFILFSILPVHIEAGALLLSPLLDFVLDVFGVELILAEVLPCGTAPLLLVGVEILVRLLVLVNDHGLVDVHAGAAPLADRLLEALDIS